MAATPPTIEVKNVSFQYGNEQVIDHVSFTIQQGDYVGLIGPNGGGKSTLVKLMLGLLSPDEGSVQWFGKPLQEFDKSRIGYIPQRIDAVDQEFPATVEEIVHSGRVPRVGLFHRFSKADNAAVSNALRVAQIESLRSRQLNALSGGQRQRVFIARALACEPNVLILDEPTVGVDVASQEQFYQFLEHLHRDLHITILFITHEIDVIANEAQSLLCINRSLRFHGSPKEFIKGDYLEKLYGRDVKMIVHGH